MVKNAGSPPSERATSSGEPLRQLAAATRSPQAPGNPLEGLVRQLQLFIVRHADAFVIARMPRRGMGKAAKAAVEATRPDGPQKQRMVDPRQYAAAHATEFLHYASVRVHQIAGDGRCFFRALAQGMAKHQGRYLSPYQEEKDADELRLAVHDALCANERRAQAHYGSALSDIQQHERRDLEQYCRDLRGEDFWGGNPEMMVLSSLLRVPIYIYGAGTDFGGDTRDYLTLAKYGNAYEQPSNRGRGRRPVRLLFTGNNHFDLLEPR